MSRYRTIVVDPPWTINKRIGKGGRRSNETEVPYEMLSVAEIKAFAIGDMADNDAHLFLWSTRRLFREGTAAEVARAWGFEPVGEIVWGLRNQGTGAGVLTNDHEPVLVATRGSLPWPKGEPMGVHFWKQPYIRHASGVPMKVHSAKPEGFFDYVTTLSPGPYLECFARKNRLGWHTWGDECISDVDVLVDVAEPELESVSPCLSCGDYTTGDFCSDECESNAAEKWHALGMALNKEVERI